jgi:hypothetical protein
VHFRELKEVPMRSSAIMMLVALGIPSIAAAQTAVQQQPAAPPPTLAQIGMIIYPAGGQTPEQQQADEAACTQWAEAQTGLTLQAGGVDTQAAAQAAQQQAAQATQGAAVVGAAKGAAVGVAIGAIAGDAGKGAAIGAVAGGVAGRRAKKQAEAQAAQQGAAQAQAQNQQAIDTFKKAAGACLEGRGYSVK